MDHNVTNNHCSEHHAEHHHEHCSDHHAVQLPKQNWFCYTLARFASFLTAKLIFRKKFIRNELKGKKGPMVVIANHQAAFDFVNLIGATRRPMTFVISESFYNTVPVKGIIKGMGVIPKQQFQTGIREVRSMRKTIDSGKILTIYPAGLMCEDGLSTPIPSTTYKFLQWLKADVYVARSYGSYFVMPKWTKGLRPGRTDIDIYKLCDAEQLSQMDEEQIKSMVDGALLFDAYREQDERRYKYKSCGNIEGLENVLYMCPECKSEFTMSVRDGNTIYCSKCGFAHRSDEYGLLHNVGETDGEIRYVSDWSRLISEDMYDRIVRGDEGDTCLKVKIKTVDIKSKKFADAGEGEVRLTPDHFYINGVINGEQREIAIPTATFASLPFSPNKHFELQHGEEIFRCTPEDARVVMRFVKKVQTYHRIAEEKRVEAVAH